MIAGGLILKSASFIPENGANVVTSSQLKAALAEAKAKVGKEIDKILTMAKEKQ